MSKTLKSATFVLACGLLTSSQLVLSAPMDTMPPVSAIPTIPETLPIKAQVLRERSGLKNTFAKLRAGQPVTIAYFGGSITAGSGASTPTNSYRARVTRWFDQNFPQSKVTEINAAIGGTGSDLGVFRMRENVLRHQPDLIFIEFSVNDAATTPARILQSMEGIFRQAWKANPETDLCLIYTYQKDQQSELERGFFPRAASVHDFLAERYGVPAISVSLPIADMIREGKMLPQTPIGADKKPLPLPEGVRLFAADGVHPKDEAMEIYAQTITDSMAILETTGSIGAHLIPAPLVANNYEKASLFPLKPDMMSAGWKALGGEDEMAKRFKTFLPQLWQANGAGETLSFTFRGTTAKIFDVVGPDGGQLWVTVDGVRKTKPYPRFDKYSTYHRIQTLTLCENLPDAIHTVKIEIDAAQPDRTPALNSEKAPEQINPDKYNGTFVRIGWLMLDGNLE